MNSEKRPVDDPTSAASGRAEVGFASAGRRRFCGGLWWRLLATALTYMPGRVRARKRYRRAVTTTDAMQFVSVIGEELQIAPPLSVAVFPEKVQLLTVGEEL